MKVLIAGAGIAGLAAGWRLAQAGMQVEIVERGLAGRGATWAAAGMLAASAELGAETTPVARFAREARAAWPDFARELEAVSGRNIGLREEGALLVATGETRGAELRRLAATLAARSIPADWLPPGALFAREPSLSRALLGALWLPEEAQVNARAAAGALIEAYRRSGGALRELCPAKSLWVEDGRVVGLLTAEGAIAADAVVLACGAWLHGIGGIDPERLPVRPVKGQIAAVEPPAGTVLPRALIWEEHVYLVPRQDRLLIGATVEEAGFDTAVTRAAEQRLLSAAAKLIPGLADWTLRAMWSGLRPCTPDAAPIIGSAGMPGLFVVNGQFRNGILFAPLTADAIRRLVLGQSVSESASAFDPLRYAA